MKQAFSQSRTFGTVIEDNDDYTSSNSQVIQPIHTEKSYSLRSLEKTRTFRDGKNSESESEDDDELMGSTDTTLKENRREKKHATAGFQPLSSSSSSRSTRGMSCEEDHRAENTHINGITVISNSKEPFKIMGSSLSWPLSSSRPQIQPNSQSSITDESADSEWRRHDNSNSPPDEGSQTRDDEIESCSSDESDWRSRRRESVTVWKQSRLKVRKCTGAGRTPFDKFVTKR